MAWQTKHQYFMLRLLFGLEPTSYGRPTRDHPRNQMMPSHFDDRAATQATFLDLPTIHLLILHRMGSSFKLKRSRKLENAVILQSGVLGLLARRPLNLLKRLDHPPHDLHGRWLRLPKRRPANERTMGRHRPFPKFLARRLISE